MEEGQQQSGGGDLLAPGQSMTQMMLQEESDIQELQERERSIRQLESDIVDVNTIFKDLATMVHEQGEMVDSIEANVESTQVRVTEGTDQLRQAEQYKVKFSTQFIYLHFPSIRWIIIFWVLHVFPLFLFCRIRPERKSLSWLWLELLFWSFWSSLSQLRRIDQKSEFFFAVHRLFTFEFRRRHLWITIVTRNVLFLISEPIEETNSDGHRRFIPALHHPRFPHLVIDIKTFLIQKNK